MSSLPPTMAAARAGPALLHRGLPDEIAIWEILARLPPKALLRCRAVCRAWRRVISSRDFLLAHHDRQPTVPLLYGYQYGDDGRSLDIIPFDRQADVAAADQLQSVARLGDAMFDLKASCDGLVVLSVDENFSICNPATRQYAPLRQLDGFAFALLGMYTHIPTGECRLLLYDDLPHDAQYASYVFTVGFGQPPPRHVGYLDAEEMSFAPLSVLFRGKLHWLIEQHDSADNLIMVFDTTTELFRQMHGPPVWGCELFEMGDMLSMSSFSNAATVVDIWAMQDYEREVWAFKYRVELPVAEIKVQFAKFDSYFSVVAASWDGDVLVLVKSCDWLFHVDVNSKLVASFHRRGLYPTQLGLKQTLVSHTFFPTIEGYVANASPFILQWLPNCLYPHELQCV